MPTLALAGDVMLGRGVDRELRTLEPDEPWGDWLALLHGCDLRLVNLECALTRSRTPWRFPKVFHFGADPSAVRVLQAARIDCCSLANNHVLDFETEGLLETLRTLDAAGIAHAGAGRTRAEAWRPALLDAGGVRVAFLAVTDNEPDFAAGAAQPGTAYLDPGDPQALPRLAQVIADARRDGAQLVILSNHWGPNMVERPPPAFRAFAHAAVALGVDLYFGHSAHLAQGIEVVRGRPILYDAGDFLDDYAVDQRLRNDWSFLFLVHVEEGAPVEVELVPARLHYAQVVQAEGEEAEAIRARMRRLCGELGTEVEQRGERLVVDCRAGEKGERRPRMHEDGARSDLRSLD